MPSLCEDLKTSYEHFQKLTAEFTANYSVAKDSGDLREVRRLRQDLETARDALVERLAVFTVRSAENPYHEALIEAGLDAGKTEEEQEMTVDISKEIQRQLAVYRVVKDVSENPCLEEWVKDITENAHLIYAEVLKDRARVIERIREGMIPIIMPGKSVQERTWEAALTKLKPILMKDGIEEALNDGYLYTGYKTDTTKKMTVDGFFKDIPDRPYLVWVKPTQEPHPDTRNKSFDKQQVYYATLVKEHPDLYDPTDLIPTEYSALQAIFASYIQREFEERRNGTDRPVEINPLDSKTYTRFLSAGTFSTHSSPATSFFPGSRRVRFKNEASTALNESGFRPASRT